MARLARLKPAAIGNWRLHECSGEERDCRPKRSERLDRLGRQGGVVSPVRQGAASIYRILIVLFAAAVVVEIFLAGLGIFRAMPAEDKSVSHETIEHKFDAHAALGDFLGGGAVLLLILVLIAWPARRSIGATLALALLTVVQGVLGGTGDSAPVAGALHAVNAFLILGLSLVLTWQAWRGQLLIPPLHARGTAVSPSSAP